jgi:hypothetical protein
LLRYRQREVTMTTVQHSPDPEVTPAERDQAIAQRERIRRLYHRTRETGRAPLSRDSGSHEVTHDDQDHRERQG